MHVCYNPYTPSAQGGQGKVLDPLELELWMIMSHHGELNLDPL